MCLLEKKVVQHNYTPSEPAVNITSGKKRRVNALRVTPNVYFADTNRHECYYCGCVLNDTNRSEDHVIPKSKKVQKPTRNYVFCCKVCNEKKGDLLVDQWHDLLCDQIIRALVRVKYYERIIINLEKKFALKTPLQNPNLVDGKV